MNERNGVMTPAPEMSIEELLAPIAVDAPCGVSLRYESIFTEIRLEREEDDPSLSMRHWERPLKVADWALIDRRCSAIIATRSKDLQLCAWLLEAWVRRYELVGLLHGLRLLSGLAERHWDTLFPLMEDSQDIDARLAPFEWLNETLTLTLKLHITLVHLVDRKPSRLNLAEWDKMTKAELKGAAAAQGQEAPLTRSLVIASAEKLTDSYVAHQKKLTRQCRQALGVLDDCLRARMGNNSPSTGHIAKTLELMARALDQIVPEVVLPPQAEAVSTTPEVQTMTQDAATEPSAPGDLELPPAANSAAPAPISTSGWQTRDQAYQALESIATYLHRTEPHSPTPYLIKRAVNWGRMPLPELMAEVIREEGDLNKLINLLGLSDPSDRA
jgi:type VI secretion system protein ImpA